MRTKPLKAPVVMFLAVVVLIAAFFVGQQFLGGNSKPDVPSSQLPAPRTSPTESARDIGAGVLGEGEAARGLTAKIGLDQTVPVEGAESLGPVLDIGPSGQLPGKVKLFLPLNRNITSTPGEPHNGLPFVATRSDGAAEWSYLEASVTADGKYAVVEVDHLSRFWPFSTNNWDERFKELFLPNLTKSLGPVPEPSCENQTKAKEGFRLQWNGKPDTLRGCLGLDAQGRRYLKVVSTTRFPLDIKFKGLERQRGPVVFPDSFTKLVSPNWALLPRQEATFLVTGDSAELTTDVSGRMQSLYQLDVGLRTLERILVMGKPGSVDDVIVFASGVKEAEKLTKVIQLNACYDAVMAGKPWTELVHECFAMDKLIELLGTVGKTLNSLLLFDELSSFVVSQWDFLKAQFTNDGHGTLFVRRTAPKVDPGLVGSWTAWNVWVEIGSDGSGKIGWDCDRRGCEAKFKVASASGKTLTVEVTSSTYSGPTSVSNSQSFKVGDRITFSPSGTLGVLNVDGPGLGTLCGAQAPVGYCGGG